MTLDEARSVAIKAALKYAEETKAPAWRKHWMELVERLIRDAR